MEREIYQNHQKREDGEPTGVELLQQLEPFVAAELNRHEAQAKIWYPHEYIPWDEGSNYARLGGEDWEEAQSRLDHTAQTAMKINLLTEDNLPSYHRAIYDNFKADGAWGTWVGRWTAEEARHAYVLRAYLEATRGIDPIALEDDRMTHMINGFDEPKDPLHTLAYVTFQELATRISHRNTGTAAKEEIGEKLLQRIAMDENLHMVFYRNVVEAALTIAPNQTMRAITDEVRNFQMPGAGMPAFRRGAVEIAMAGIYDLPQHHKDVIMPVLKKWKVFERDDFTGEGAEARDELAEFMDTQKLQVAKFIEVRDRKLAKIALRNLE